MKLTRVTKFVAIIVFLQISFFQQFVHAGLNYWTNNGPEGGFIQAMAIDPANTSTVYVGTWFGGIFKTTNAGVNWYFAGLGSLDIECLAIDPSNTSTIYAGTSENGIFKSTDGGANWTESGLATLNQVRVLAIDPEDTSTLYAGTSDLFKSTDAGLTWSPLGLGSGPYHFAIDPFNTSTIYVHLWDQGIFKSTDGGSTWSPSNNGLTSENVFALVTDPVTSSTLYAGGYNAIFKSTDGGGNWSSITTDFIGRTVQELAVDPANNSILYATTTDASSENPSVHKSTDGGVTWSAINLGIPSFAFIWTLAIDNVNPAILYAGSISGGAGVFKSTDAGASWQSINTGLINWYVRALSVDPNCASTLYTGTFGGIFKSTDSGATWDPSNAGLPDRYNHWFITSLIFDPVTLSTLYSVTSGGIFKSTDGAENWRRSGLPSWVRSLAIDPTDSTTLYASRIDRGMFKSTDAGANWFRIAGFITGSLAIDPADPSTVYAGSGCIYKSTNAGADWSCLLDTPQGAHTILIDPIVSSTVFAVTYGAVLKSTNGGITWNVGGPPAFVRTLAISPINSSIVYAGTDGGVFLSSDGGANWNAMNAGLTNMKVRILAIDPGDPFTVYAGTAGGGVFDITVRDCTPPQIIVQPANESIGTGQSATLEVVASSGTPLTYQWYSAATGDRCHPIPGATSSSYTTPPLFNNTDYWVRVSDSCGWSNSETATVTITLTPCLFCDDFEDGLLADSWTYFKPQWTETGGNLVGRSPSGRKATAIARPVFPGCSRCSIEAVVQTSGGGNNKLMLFGWFQDKNNTLEVIMKEESKQWILQQRMNGVIVAKTKASATIETNAFYVVKVVYDGTDFVLHVNGTQIATLTAVGSPHGTIGFQVKDTTAYFASIAVN